MDYNTLRILLLLVLVFISLIQDIKYFKVKNITNLTFIIFGLVLSVFDKTLFSSLIGLIFPLLLMPLFIFKMLGAGDIKLFCAIGSIIGYPKIALLILSSVILNGIIALILMLVRKQDFSYFFGWLKICILGKKIIPYSNFKIKSKNMFPYTLGITAAAICYVLSL